MTGGGIRWNYFAAPYEKAPRAVRSQRSVTQAEDFSRLMRLDKMLF